MYREFLQGRLVVKTGDITDEDVDAIVNAANSTLLGGGGVDGAIHVKGGPAILEECKKIRSIAYPDGLPTGLAVITSGGNLAARHVIHTVGPIYGVNPGLQSGLLADCYMNSIELAVSHGITSIAFPSISTGAYGYPKDEAAIIASRSIRNSLKKHDGTSVIRLVFFSVRDTEKFLKHADL